MEDTLKISKEAPEQKSQNFKFLREEGIKYIQEMAGKIWSDYNIHDPGITILEALCYAITDLGYRASYPMKDLITLNKNGSDIFDIKNFFTAGKILPNAPLTKNDYRKLLIDTEIEITIPGSGNKEYVGVKNAWVDKSENAEVSFYVYIDENTSNLSYAKNPPKSNQEAIQVGILYNILLEFDKSDYYGDLNENTIEGELTIYSHPDDTALEGLVIDVQIVCPRWDEEIDWNDLEDIIKNTDTQKIKLTFYNRPENYYVKSYSVTGAKKFEIEIYEKSESAENIIKGLEKIRLKIEEFIFDSEKGVIKKYQEKILIIKNIIEKVKASLHSNRNLCEDFYKISALKVEEIAVCTDVELGLDADIEQVQAKIFHEISKFLSPVVNFYTIREMLDLCKVVEKYSIKSINRISKIFTIDKNITEKLSVNDTISIQGSTSNNGDYTVVSVTVNSFNSNYSDITVNEDISSDMLTEGEVLCASYSNDEDCYTIDTIFEGPLLEHGFIDNTELENADRKRVIHVSDLIQIIMKISGVVAVKEIQIANIPQDNEENKIPSKNVIWCLDLAFEQNYVPRLSIGRSKFRFFKENIPFTANAEDVEDILLQLESKERDQKLINPKLDLDIPRGEYRNIEDYTSVQEDFPLIYGIGYEGVPNLSRMSKESKIMRIAQTNQMKGYLMFFDQLLANYLSQLAHVKNLFSMNAEKDEKGSFIIGRTYYTQPLFKIVPDVDKLYINQSGHKIELNTIVEDETLFATRRNKFLDHLLARFSEQFSDYALLLYRLFGNKAATDLIEEKLVFLNLYPELSTNRGKGFNYRHPEKIWHIDNVSGLAKRTSLLMGIPLKEPESLHFSNNITIIETAGEYEFTIAAGGKFLLKSFQKCGSIIEVKEILELVVINGIIDIKYAVKPDDNTKYYFELVSSDVVLGKSNRIDYISEQEAKADIQVLIGFFEKEFGISEGWVHENPESNRYNLAIPFYNYFKVDDPVTNSDGSKSFNFDLYSKAFKFDPENNILFGSFTIENNSEDIERDKQQHLWEVITNGIVEKQYLFSSEGDYVFQIGNRAGNILATSVEKNFNQGFANKLSLLNNLKICIENSESNDGYYPISTVTAKGPDIILTCKEKEISAESIDGNLLIIESFNYTKDTQNKKITIIGDITQKITENCIINIFVPGNAKNYYFTLSSFKLEGSNTEIILNEDIQDAEGNSEISITKTYPYSLDESNKTFSIDFDARLEIESGDIITMWDGNDKLGYYTINSFLIYGNQLRIIVDENIAIDKRGRITFKKLYPIVNLKKDPGALPDVKSVFTIKGGEDRKAVQLMINFLKRTFINREGFHVIEHSLLRPKHKQLQPGLSQNGTLLFTKKVTVSEAKSSAKKIVLDGNLATGLREAAKSRSSSIVNLQLGQEAVNLSIDSVVFRKTKNKTEVKVIDDFKTDISGSGSNAFLSYQVSVNIEKISDNGSIIIVHKADIKPSDKFVITGSSGGVNDGEYYVDSVDANGITITIICDQLMPVILHPLKECPYQIENPYTCIASVVLPYWPERFNNSDFRKFFEQTLRMETPAHIFLRICWVNPHHMRNLEAKFKKWILENSRKNADQVKISHALSELIDALYQLRNVYPVGTLYDPEEHKTLENTIILNNTMIGNA